MHADDMAEVENPRTNCSVQNDELYCEPTILSDRSNFSNLKKVHWALNLEEISYFSPDECKTSDSILKKLKIKARSLKNLDICDDLLQKMQEVIERMMDKIFRHSGEFRIQDFNDLKNDWDKLFELYGEWTWNRMLGYDICRLLKSVSMFKEEWARTPLHFRPKSVRRSSQSCTMV